MVVAVFSWHRRGQSASCRSNPDPATYAAITTGAATAKGEEELSGFFSGRRRAIAYFDSKAIVKMWRLLRETANHREFTAGMEVDLPTAEKLLTYSEPLSATLSDFGHAFTSRSDFSYNG